ncbi:MAG TPA: hypothetical protein VH436_10405 [Vicinamibacterales bacterium]|jgi:hypothetical protein
MKSKVPALLIFMLVFGVFVITQSVDGKWTGEVQGGRGPQQVSLTLKADGTKLTGTTAGRGGDTPIADGTINKNEIKFKTTQQGRGGEITMEWTGTLKGDEIAMKRSVAGREGAPQEFTLKREK